MPKIINAGSVDDIRCMLKLEKSRLTIKQLLLEIEAETKGQNRKTVIDMLQAAITNKINNPC
jgi:hypothetical protein